MKWQLQDPTAKAITVTGQVIGPSSQPIAGASVSLCADPICRFPSATADSDAEGRVALNLLLTPGSSTTPLYLQVHAAGFFDELLTYATPPPYFDFDAGQLSPTPTDVLDPYYALAGAVRDPSRTTLIVSTNACSGLVNTSASDVITFTLPDGDGGATTAYVGDDGMGGLSFATTPNGAAAAFIFNAPVPEGGLTSNLVRIEAHVGTALIARASAAVRTDALSVIALAPMP